MYATLWSMLKNKKRLFFLLLAVLAVSGDFCIIKIFAPDTKFDIFYLQIPVIALFFTASFTFLFCSIAAVFNSSKQAILIACFSIIYLTFRYLSLTKLLYQILLLLIFISVELLFLGKKKEKE